MRATVLFSLFFSLSFLMGQTITWTEIQPAGNVGRSWSRASISADGSKMIVGANLGRLYISTNGGSTWAETQPAGDVNFTGGGVIMSSDGNTIFCGFLNQNIYKSTNTGSTWEQITPSGSYSNEWSVFAASSDLSKIIVGKNPGRLYISTDLGSNWSETQPIGDANGFWWGVAMGSNGNNIFAGAQFRLYISTNGGSSWSETRPIGDVDAFWRTVAMSADGSVLIAAINNGRVHRSTDGGSTWSETQPGGDANYAWQQVDCNSDGTKMIISAHGGRVYLSTNSGATWFETQPAGNANRAWGLSKINADGTKMITARELIYLNDQPLPVELVSFTAGISGKNVLLSWKTASEVNNYGFEIQRSRTASTEDNGINNWSSIGFVNGHGNSNAEKHYTFTDETPGSGIYYYRLKQIDTDGAFEYSNTVSVNLVTNPGFSLNQNHPNPFNPATTITYSIDRTGEVSLIVYNALGKEVQRLASGIHSPGQYEAVFNGENLGSGIYFYTLSAGTKTAFGKMLLMK